MDKRRFFGRSLDFFSGSPVRSRLPSIIFRRRNRLSFFSQFGEAPQFFFVSVGDVKEEEVWRDNINSRLLKKKL